MDQKVPVDSIEDRVKQNERTLDIKDLTDEERSRLAAQNNRMVSEFQARKLEEHCRKNWDLFYKVSLQGFSY